jgi:hypothetical protein
MANQRADALPAPLSQRLFALVGRHGTPQEKRLVEAHRLVLARFLDHPDVRPGSPRNELDIGLENSPVLKFNLIASRFGSPWAMIEQVAQWAPGLVPVADTVIQLRLRCHVGLKLSGSGVEYELYPYETESGDIARRLLPSIPLHNTGLPATPYCYGINSAGDLSAYAEIDGLPTADLETISGWSLPAAGLRTKALFHSRYNPQTGWRSSKAGIEFLPFPSHLINAALSQMNIAYSYLLHRGGKRSYGVIGLLGERQFLYTTLLPRPPAVKPDANRTGTTP